MCLVRCLFRRKIGAALATIANDSDGGVAKAVKVRDKQRINSARSASTAHMALFQLKRGRLVRSTDWLSEIYFIEDTEPG
jgi:hypothetical protein